MEDEVQGVKIIAEGLADRSNISVSVIMPVYNVEKYLDECMTSLINQTLKNIEIICVDDGSTDNSLEILKKYGENDDRIIIETQKNQYAGVARNNGFKLARGKYVIFLDSDDFFELNMLELAYERAELTQAEICVFRGIIYNNETGKKCLIYYNHEITGRKDIKSPKELGVHLFETVCVVPWNKLYLRKFIDYHNLEFQKIKYSNDVSFVYTSVILADKITFLNNALVNYRVGRGDSIQDNVNENDPLISLVACSELKNNLVKHNVYHKFQVCFANMVCKTISLLVANFCSHDEKFHTLYQHIRVNAISEYDLCVLNVYNVTQPEAFRLVHSMLAFEIEDFKKVVKLNVR